MVSAGDFPPHRPHAQLKKKKKKNRARTLLSTCWGFFCIFWVWAAMREHHGRCPSAGSSPLPSSQAAGHSWVTRVGLLLGSLPASLLNYRVIQRPRESLPELGRKLLLQKSNLTQSQQHILGFTTERSWERHRAKSRLLSQPRSKASPAQRAGKDARGTGREQRGGQGWGFKHLVQPFNGDTGQKSSLLEAASGCLQDQLFPLPAFNLEQRSARQR